MALHSKPEIDALIMVPLDEAIKAALPDASPALRPFLEWSLKRFGQRTGEYTELQRRHQGGPYTKFLAFTYYARVKLSQMRQLGLADSKPLRILDLGCGAGHVQLIAKYLGHECVGLDVADYGVFNDLRKFFGVDCIEHRIEKQQPLPDTGGGFDLVTGFMVKFDTKWSVKDWEHLVADLRKNHLKPDGRLYFGLNKEATPACCRYVESLSC